MDRSLIMSQAIHTNRVSIQGMRITPQSHYLLFLAE
jgi:hypothetical protein